MSEWYDSQKYLSSNFRKSLLERIDKANPRSTLTAEEERRLSKLEAIVSRLKRGENVRSSDGVTHLLHTYYEVTISD